MATVSLCMIVRNEEDVLGRCLDSVKGLVDEIILVDTGSTDRTKEVASQYTDKIYDYPWKDDFAAARNFSFSKAAMDYQMWLDADDVILEEDGKLFLEMKEKLGKMGAAGAEDAKSTKDAECAPDEKGTEGAKGTEDAECAEDAKGTKDAVGVKGSEDAKGTGGMGAAECAPDVVMMKYHTAFDIDGLPVMSYNRERLLKRANGYRWVGAVHEVVVPWGQILYSEAAVTHKKVHPSDPDRNLRIYQKLIEQGVALDPRQQFYYARELADHARYGEAAEVLQDFMDQGKGWKENNISACLDLARCRLQLGQDQAALLALFSSFSYDLPRAEACCGIGAWFLDRKQYDQASYWYQQAAECTPDLNSGGFFSPDCYGFIPYVQLCVCYDRMGDIEKARFYHEKAKELKPDAPAVLYNESYFASRERRDKEA